MKINLTLLLCLFFFISLSAQDDAEYNLLWKIEKKGENQPSYLFGTMHVRDERAFNFSDSVMVSIEKCDQFAMEVHPDTMMIAMYREILNPDTTNYYKDYLSEEEYQKFIKRFEEENGFSFDDLESKNPMVVKSLDDAEDAYRKDRQTFVDMYLYGIARTMGKEVHGLENIQSQIESLKRRALRRARFHFPVDTSYKKHLENELADVYSKGNLNSINQTIGTGRLNDQQFIKRNEVMTNSIIRLMKNSSVFAAVGAAHLIGDQSVIAMLRKAGYQVSQVPSSFTGVADQYEIDPTKMPWTAFKDEEAGILVYFPNNSNNFSKNMAYPLEDRVDSVRMNIWLYTDMTNLSNYLFTYNDFPIGYYFESVELGFEEFEEELKGSATFVSPPKSILREGVAGKEYDVLLKDKYLTKIQVYVRGNRIYKFMVQNLSQNRKELSDNRFINSIHFLPYKKTEVSLNKTAHPFVEFPQFSDYRLDIDSINNYDAYLNNTISAATVNPNSGGCYITVTYEIDPFLQIEHLDTFYNEFAEGLTEWRDTLTYQKEIMIDGLKGQEVLFENKYQRGFNRHRYWINGNQLIMQSAYTDSVEIWSQVANDYFNTVKVKEVPPALDLYSSKSKAILEGLGSSDTLLRKRAIGALDYYEFQSEDLGLIHQSLKNYYASDTLDDGPVARLLRIVENLEDATSVPFLVDLYAQKAAKPDLAVSLLTTLVDLGAQEESLRLFFESPPENVNYTYQLFNPFRDSLGLTIAYFDQLLELAAIEDYQQNVISLFTQMGNKEDPRLQEKVENAFDKISILFDQKLASHKVKLADPENESYYSGGLFQYVYFLKAFPHESSQSFLNELSQVDSNEYLQLQILLAKVINQVEVEEEAIDSLLQKRYYIYDLMCAYDRNDQLSRLPDSLRTTEAYIQYKFDDYLSYEDMYPDTTLLLDKFVIEDTTLHVFQLVYEDSEEDKGQYLGVVGPIIKGQAIRPKDLKAYYFWMDDKEKNRQEAVEEILPNFRKWGY